MVFPASGSYIFGIIKRLYWLLPSLLADPFDIAERLFNVTYVAPPYLVWILVGLGLFIASFLTYRELYVSNKKIVERETATSLPRREGALGVAHMYALLDIQHQMKAVHGHSDDNGLEADLRDGISLSDLMKRDCTKCG